MRVRAYPWSENSWPTVLKFIKIQEFYQVLKKFVKIRKSSFLRIFMNALSNFDFVSFMFAFFCV